VAASARGARGRSARGPAEAGSCPVRVIPLPFGLIMVVGAFASLFRAGHRGHLGLETAPPAVPAAATFVGEP